MELKFKKDSNVVKEKIDMKKYMCEGEKSKLSYPKPEKSKKNEYLSSPEMEEKLEYPTKKLAEKFNFKQKDIMDLGEKEKLQYGKTVDFPDEGDVKVISDEKIGKEYKFEGEKGEISKSKEFTVGDVEKAEKIDTKKYFLNFEKAKPFQKQFSLDEKKKSGRSLKEWMDELKQKGIGRKTRRKFKHIWENSLKEGKDEEYAARAAIDSLPKGALEKPTPVHGPEKRGPIKTSYYLPIADIINYSILSLVKMAKENPEEFKILSDTIDFKTEIKKSATISEEIQKKQESILKTQEELSRLQNELAELQKKQAEETASQVK